MQPESHIERNGAVDEAIERFNLGTEILSSHLSSAHNGYYVFVIVPLQSSISDTTCHWMLLDNSSSNKVIDICRLFLFVWLTNGVMYIGRSAKTDF